VKSSRASGCDPWWRPYVVVLTIALAACVVVLLFLLANLGEISRSVRSLGG
jgi:hypothetical protein